jgi:hypothetical protein
LNSQSRIINIQCASNLSTAKINGHQIVGALFRTPNHIQRCSEKVASDSPPPDFIDQLDPGVDAKDGATQSQ